MMKKQKLNQSGFAHIIIIVVLIVLGIGGYSLFRLLQTKQSTYTAENTEAKAMASAVKIKSLPIEIDKYDPATGKAGEIMFPAQAFDKGVPDLIFMGYGYVVPAELTPNKQAKSNPQPTFIAPVGTKVRALIDGEVIAVPSLYSKDYSIHMKGKGSDLIFETEHVINVKVKVGDQVKAGAVIAEVSDYSTKGYAGLGLIEIGVLKGGKTPEHLCTFDFLDDSIKSSTQSKLTQLEKDWEEFRGKPDLYGAEATPGCVTRDVIADNINSQTGTTNN